uniref:G-protein coupled receptors family 1 profile domain-containing protein n=1 Tax=Seriola lalandi dorsalis TaxID=1841481 RepID=A0A3B4WLY3_SERLL
MELCATTLDVNMTISSDILEIQGFDISPEFTYPLFFLLLFVYFSLLFSNIGVLVLIITEKSLHQPMYILFCNLSVNDLIGNTVLLPQLMAHIISTERFITYNQCVIQAFHSHTFGSASHMILVIMAIDRYVAICHPLRYSSIMTTKTVFWLSATAWGVSLVLVSVLIGLTVRLSRCRSVIQNAYCDNASLFKLSCEDVSINNIYGLFFTVLLFSCSIGGIAATYFRIALICWIKKNKELNNRALQTCASHLVLYLIMLWSGFLTIILHRFPNYPDLRKIAYILFHVVPANLNPIIYGMQTRSLRDKIIQILQRKLSPT